MAHFSTHVDQTKLYTTERIPTFTFVADGPAATNKSLHGSQTQLANAKSSIPDNSNSISMQKQQQQKEYDNITTTRTVPPGALHIIPSWQPLDANEKPPYSYATLIAHAILSSEHRRLTLCDIYQWITQHYPFYSMAEHGWQNSIRHNLSLNKSFVRIQRLSKTNSGKGSFWTIRAGQELGFIDNLIKRRGPIRKQPVNLPRTLQHRRSSHRLDDSSLPTAPINNSHLFTTFRMTPTRSTSTCFSPKSTSAPLGRSPTHRKRSMPELNQLQQAIEDGHESDCDSGVDFGYQKRWTNNYRSPLKKAKSTPCLYDDPLCHNDAAMMDSTFETLLSTSSSLSSAEDLSNWTDLVTPPLFEWDPLFPTASPALPSCMDMSYQHLLLEPTASFVHQPPPPPLPPTTTSANGLVGHDYMLDDPLLMTGWPL